MGFSKMLELLQQKNKGYIILANAGAFYLARGKDAVIMYEIELENKSKIKVIGYNKIADKCYKELEKEDTIWIEGRIEEKQIKNRAQPLDKSEKYDIIDSVTRRRQTSHLIQRKKVIQKNIKNKK